MKTPLDRAIAACREAEPTRAERLCAGARARLLSELRSDSPSHRRWRMALFPPVWRLALAGALPVAAVVTVVLWTAPRPVQEGVATASLHVTKVEDQVVFWIDNGGRHHVVVRSERADRFDASRAEPLIDASYADHLDAGPKVVFYRID